MRVQSFIVSSALISLSLFGCIKKRSEGSKTRAIGVVVDEKAETALFEKMKSSNVSELTDCDSESPFSTESNFDIRFGEYFAKRTLLPNSLSSKLSFLEVFSLEHYVGDHFEDFNRALIGDCPNLLPFAQLVSQGLLRIPPKKAHVFSGSTLAFMELRADYKKNSEVIYKDIMSTSLNEAVALSFARVEDNNTVAVLYEIKESSGARDIAEFGLISEDEFTVPPGEKYIVEDDPQKVTQPEGSDGPESYFRIRLKPVAAPLVLPSSQITYGEKSVSSFDLNHYSPTFSQNYFNDFSKAVKIQADEIKSKSVPSEFLDHTIVDNEKEIIVKHKSGYSMNCQKKTKICALNTVKSFDFGDFTIAFSEFYKRTDTFLDMNLLMTVNAPVPGDANKTFNQFFRCKAVEVRVPSQPADRMAIDICSIRKTASK